MILQVLLLDPPQKNQLPDPPTPGSGRSSSAKPLGWSPGICLGFFTEKRSGISYLSGQMIIFHQPRFFWNIRGDFPSSATFWDDLDWGRYKLPRYMQWMWLEYLPSPKRTTSLHLKMDGWKTTVSFWDSLFSRPMLVFGSAPTLMA